MNPLRYAEDETEIEFVVAGNDSTRKMGLMGARGVDQVIKISPHLVRWFNCGESILKANAISNVI